MKFTTAHKRVNGATDKISELINRLFIKKNRSYDLGYGQSLATNALKHLMDQLEEKILQTDQLKNVLSVCSIVLIPVIFYYSSMFATSPKNYNFFLCNYYLY